MDMILSDEVAVADRPLDMLPALLLAVEDGRPLARAHGRVTMVKGSMGRPSLNISKWRCGAVDLPLDPESAMTSPWRTRHPRSGIR